MPCHHAWHHVWWVLVLGQTTGSLQPRPAQWTLAQCSSDLTPASTSLQQPSIQQPLHSIEGRYPSQGLFIEGITLRGATPIKMILKVDCQIFKILFRYDQRTKQVSARTASIKCPQFSVSPVSRVCPKCHWSIMVDLQWRFCSAVKLKVTSD